MRTLALLLWFSGVSATIAGFGLAAWRQWKGGTPFPPLLTIVIGMVAAGLGVAMGRLNTRKRD